MFENIRLSFQGIWSHKMRSFLTMLGIIIGIASIISIVSTIKGTNDEIKNNLIGAGNNTVQIKLEENGFEYSVSDGTELPFGVPEVTEKVKKEILELDSVENVTCYTERKNPEQVFYRNQSLAEFAVRGIDTNYFTTNGYIIRTGRNFRTDDLKRFRKVLIVDDELAENLFPGESPIGKVIEIRKVPFTIIGSVKKAGKFQPRISSIADYKAYTTNTPGNLYMPKACWPVTYFYDEPEHVIVKAVSVDDMEAAGREAEKILNATISPKQTALKYKADDVLKRANDMQNLSEASNKQLIWIASISLLVGGIGVMNIMLVSVTERTSEIGLKKAIGARKGAILWQFLTEAAVLTSTGGLIGVIAGIAMAQVISQVSQVAVSISVPASVAAVLFSMAIGIVFGLLPSVKAANLDPIEALRRE